VQVKIDRINQVLRENLAGLARRRSADFRWERAAELAEGSFRQAIDDRA
jgi:hypothetical protein